MSLERELRQKIRRTKIQAAVLGSIKIAGILAVSVLAPNVLGALGRIQKMSGHSQPRADNIKSAAQRLADKGFIKFEKRKKGVFLVLTEKGEQYVRQASLADFQIRKPKQWDKRWRLVLFDIPERRKRLREILRDTLVRIGFIRLQDSVWVYPYDCEKLIIMLKADFRVGKDVLYMIVDKIENDKAIRSRFGLTK
ncbi:MAG: phenylacetic acid degradation operon negative regulatory protein [Parcubacteria group bacterium Gr01-1014_56]|nr:MAG: phenylacetic acid degradation operon negative regulatory protein [Parcubacteria group bacterium Gr01-1014_56]